MSRLAVAAILLVACTVQILSGERLERLLGDRDDTERLLYLPNGKYLRALSMGQSALLADAIYLWAIQYYADYGREDRYLLVEHIFGDVIAGLDPQYVDAYWIGALILTTEARDLDAGLRLLDQGMAANPDKWILPYLAGWECHSFGRYEQAAEYFDRAAAVPDAPAVVLRLRAGMTAEAGDLEEAYRLWLEVLEDPRSDPASIAVAERRVRDLRVRIELAQLQSIVDAFRNRYGRAPRSIEELVGNGYLAEVPLDPSGEPYAIEDGRPISSMRLLGGK